MKKTYYFFLLTILLIGCKDFIETDLKTDSTSLLAPADLTESSKYQQTFWWETNQDALYYRLQIVSPTFSKTERLIIDTLLKTDKFIYTLEPGNYQWRVRSENGSSVGIYNSASFKIHLSSIVNQSIQIIKPVNSAITTLPEVNYEWLSLYGSTSYRIQIGKKANLDDASNLLFNVLTPNLNYKQDLTDNGTYYFRIRGENPTEQSKWSDINSFIFDNTPPEKVVLVSPTNNQSISKPFKLTWNSISDAESYEIEVYKGGTKTLYPGFPQNIKTNSLTINFGELLERMDWRVRAIDKAGNKGDFSDTFSLVVQ